MANLVYLWKRSVFFVNVTIYSELYEYLSMHFQALLQGFYWIYNPYSRFRRNHPSFPLIISLHDTPNPQQSFHRKLCCSNHLGYLWQSKSIFHFLTCIHCFPLTIKKAKNNPNESKIAQ